MINAANGMWITSQVRDNCAQILGEVVGTKLSAFSAASTDPRIIQGIVNDYQGFQKYFTSIMKSYDFVEDGVMLDKGFLVAAAGANMHTSGSEFLSLKNRVGLYHGTTHYEFNDINGMFESWVNASARLLLSADLIQNVIGGDAWSGVDSAVASFVQGATGFPIGTVMDYTDVLFALRNNMVKLYQMRDDFYGWIWDTYGNSTLLTQEIQGLGHVQVLIPMPRTDDFSITAFYQTNQMASTTINRGSSIAATVQVNLVSGSIPSVSLSVSGQDETMSASFSSTSGPLPLSSTLTISTSTATTGSHTLTITGTTGNIIHSCQVILITKNPSSSGLVTIDPVNSPVMYGTWIRYHGTADASYNGQYLWMVQSFDGGSTWDAVETSTGYNVPISNGQWSVPSDSNLVGTQVYLPTYLGLTLPINIQMETKINSQAPISNVINFQLVKATTAASISVTSNAISQGESINIDGTISSIFGISGSPYACKGTWYVEWQKNGGSWNTLNSGSVYSEYQWLGVNNPYCIKFNVPTQNWTPTSAGTYDFRVRYSGDLDYESSTSQIQEIIVAPTQYPVTVNINGLPKENATKVYLDNTLIDTISGGSSKTFYLDQSAVHQISIDPIINYGTDSRYTSQTLSQAVSNPGTINFQYNKEYLLQQNVLPAQSGTIQLSGISWFTENSAVQVQAIPNSLYSFDHWATDGSLAGTSTSLTITMDSAHLVTAFFADLTNPTPTPVPTPSPTPTSQPTPSPSPEPTASVILMSAHLPIAETSSTAIWDGNNAYIFGGSDASGTKNKIIRYNPATDQITTLGATLPDPISDTCAIYDGHYAYIFGGYMNPYPYSHKIVRYDPSTDSVKLMASTVSTISMSGVWTGHYVYLFGGWDGYSYYNQVLRYDPANDQITTMNAKFPEGIKWNSAVWTGTYAYIFGGSLDWDSPTNEIFRYDPVSDSITVMSPTLPAVSTFTSAVWTGTSALIFGGANKVVPYDKIVIYDPASNVVSTPSVALPTARSGTSAIWAGSAAYIFGGSSSSSTFFSDIVKFIPGTSPTPTPTASPTPTPTSITKLDISCRSSTTYTGFNVEITGSLENNGLVISGEPVLLSYSVTQGGSWDNLTSVITDAKGSFSATWTPSVTGNYLLKALWQGNSLYPGTHTIVNFAVASYQQQNVFSVTSNSTVSAFAFNSTSRELSFMVDGPTGTTGYVQIYIPKSLISDVSSLKVYLDGNQLSYKYDSQGDSWLISFTYHHSTHEVSLDLGSAQSSSTIQNQNVTWLYYAAVIVTIVIVIFSIILAKKKKVNPIVAKT